MIFVIIVIIGLLLWKLLANALLVFFLAISSPSSPIMGHNGKYDLTRLCFRESQFFILDRTEEYIYMMVDDFLLWVITPKQSQPHLGPNLRGFPWGLGALRLLCDDCNPSVVYKCQVVPNLVIMQALYELGECL